MKITINENGGGNIEFESNELDRFRNKCYRSHFESSIEYFRRIGDEIDRLQEEILNDNYLKT